MLERKMQALRDAIREAGSALVCFSGGVDSTLLLKVAVDELGARCFALTTVSPTMARAEREEAIRLAAGLGLGERHLLVESRELERPGFAANPTDRCYLCKSELLELAAPLAAEHRLGAILVGTNADDLGDHRPGLRAAAEHRARQPLADAGLTKAEVREASRRLGLPTWDKPQLACLSSRFPYGTEITPERLARVDAFEEGLRALGFTQLRVRFHEPIARLELDAADMARAIEPELRARIVELGRAAGFAYVALDLAGFRSGSMNEVLVPYGRRTNS